MIGETVRLPCTKNVILADGCLCIACHTLHSLSCAHKFFSVGVAFDALRLVVCAASATLYGYQVCPPRTVFIVRVVQPFALLLQPFALGSHCIDLLLESFFFCFTLPEDFYKLLSFLVSAMYSKVDIASVATLVLQFTLHGWLEIIFYEPLRIPKSKACCGIFELLLKTFIVIHFFQCIEWVSVVHTAVQVISHIVCNILRIKTVY